MDTTKTKEWYSFAERYEYKGSEPAFFNIDHFKWKKTLEDNYKIFLSEIEELIVIEEKNIIPYFNETLASKKENWTIFPLMVWGDVKKENVLKTPKTFDVIEKIEGVTSCAFSILQPHTKIKPHHGDSNVMYRVHLTLKSEASLPIMGMKVKDAEISWENGKVFAFCDAHEHEVWNDSDTSRYVLIVDILRPEFINDKSNICAKVKATLFWQLKFQRIYVFKHFPNFFRRVLMNVTSLFFIKKSQ